MNRMSNKILLILVTLFFIGWSIQWDLDDNDTITDVPNPSFTGTTTIDDLSASSGTISGMLSVSSMTATGNIACSSATVSGHVAANAFYGDGSNLTGIVTALSGLSDVNFSSPSTDDVLQYDGINWSTGTVASGGNDYEGYIRVTTDANDTDADYICDGTDDYVELNAACSTESTLVFLSSGTYILGSSSWSVTVDSITIRGSGNGTIIQGGAFTGTMASFTGDNIKISHLQIDGANTTNLNGIKSTGHFLEVSHCNFENFGTGISRALATDAGDFNQIFFNSFNNCNYMCIASLTNSNYNIVSFNTANHCATLLYTSASHYNVWNSNVIITPTSIGMWINTSANCTVMGNMCYGGTSAHAMGMYNADFCTISNNIFYRPNGNGLYLDANCQYTTISGNTFQECDYDNSGTQHGIWINGSDDISIVGNTFNNCDDHEISMASGSTNITIIGNNFGSGSDHVGYIEFANNYYDVTLIGNFPANQNYIQYVDTTTTPSYVGTRGISKADGTTVWRSTATVDANSWVQETD